MKTMSRCREMKKKLLRKLISREKVGSIGGCKKSSFEPVHPKLAGLQKK